MGTRKDAASIPLMPFLQIAGSITGNTEITALWRLNIPYCRQHAQNLKECNLFVITLGGVVE
jgi:hypothetical protein